MVCITERHNTDHAACDVCKNGPHAVATRPSISDDSARGISTNRAPRLCTETTGCSGWSTSSLTSLMMMIMMTTMRRCCISRIFFRRNRCARHAPLLLRRRRQMDVGTDQQLYSSLSVSSLRWWAIIMPEPGVLASDHCLANSIGLRSDTRCYFNVRSKADTSQLNQPHGNDN